MPFFALYGDVSNNSSLLQRTLGELPTTIWVSFACLLAARTSPYEGMHSNASYCVILNPDLPNESADAATEARTSAPLPHPPSKPDIH